MEWINLHGSILDSEEFIGSEPVERSTWLCLMRICAGQENGGIIRNCRDWSDRKWQQLVRITQDEVTMESELWGWVNDDLRVRFYPVEKERQVKENRVNGAKGGRPKKRRKRGDSSEKNPPVNQGVKQEDNQTESGGFEFAETEGKGREGNRNGMERVPPYPPNDFSDDDDSIVESDFPPCTIEQAIGFGDENKIPEACCRNWWLKLNAVGWIDERRRRITRWHDHLVAYGATWTRIDAKDAAKDSMTTAERMEQRTGLPEQEIKLKRL